MSSTNNLFTVFLKHYGLVMALAVRFAPLPDLAEDIVQDVFMEFAKEFQPGSESNVATLLRRLTQRIAKRHYYDKIRNSSETLRRIGEHFARS